MNLYWKPSLIILLLLHSVLASGQRTPVDEHGNFIVRDRRMIWQRSYPLADKEVLNKDLKSEPFCSGIDLLDFSTSTITEPYQLQAEGLPEYARHEFTSLLSIDFFPGTFRVTVKQITFPDFVEHVYYNGVRQDNGRGTLEHYVMRSDGLLSKTTANLRVLEAFDQLLSSIFDDMAQE